MSYLNQCTRRFLMQNNKGNSISTLFRLTDVVQCNTPIALPNQTNFNQKQSQMITSSTANKYNNTSMFNQSMRMMSTKSPDAEESSKEESTKSAEKEAEEKEETEEGQQPEPLTEEEKLKAEIKNLKDNLLRSLAEQENTRRIAKRDVESARQYAITSFAKSLLDTADNLSRAMDSVPEELLAAQQGTNTNDNDVGQTLTTLYEGIKMTEDGLVKAFNKNGLERYGVIGDVFDPNLHNALYEYPDKEKVPGTIGQIIKKGFSLHGRTIRPAEVGVIKKE